MAQLTDDCFAFGGRLMAMNDALDMLRRRVATVVDAEVVDLRSARERILAEDVQAGGDVPPHDNAAVDGYALRFADLDTAGETRLRVAGRAAAGHPFAGTVGQGYAVRIFTGAPMPDGCDTVMMQEDCVRDDEHVILRPGIASGANRRRAGEDITAGTVVLRHGRRLRPQEIGLAAAAGRDRLRVFRRLRAAVFSTGDELAEPGRVPPNGLPAGAIYDANRYALIAVLEGLGCQVHDLGILPDAFSVIRERLADAAAGHDLIVTSGGMSVGEEDHIKAAVEALGSLHFWQLSIKPGRPLGLGQVAGVPFVGLPGNPVAMMVTFLRIARPMILGLAGCTDPTPHVFRVSAGFTHKKKPGRLEWVRAHLSTDGDGHVVARKFPRQGSGILSSLVDADGLVELPEAVTVVEEGMAVDFLPFTEVSR